MSNRSTYRKIAKKHGVTAKEVKQDMQDALNFAYNNPKNNDVIVAYQNQVPRKGDVPTPDEFINHATKKLGKK